MGGTLLSLVGVLQSYPIILGRHGITGKGTGMGNAMRWGNFVAFFTHSFFYEDAAGKGQNYRLYMCLLIN